jgi:diadenosine tetraphosphate (Ap4A) HIT family hydrolase
MNDSGDYCPFCDLSDRPLVSRNEHAFAIRDAYPVTRGHTLVIPFRHVVDLFELMDYEMAALFALVRKVKANLENEFSPNGFNVGINIGRDAGQTVMHAHAHIIPRFAGDVDDPTGGVRSIIPGRGRYAPIRRDDT